MFFSALDQAAALLKVQSSFLKNVLEERTVETKHGAKRGTTYKVPLNKIQAIAGRDALAKGIYDRIFDWLVARINAAMHKQGQLAFIFRERNLRISILTFFAIFRDRLDYWCVGHLRFRNFQQERFRAVLYQLRQRKVATDFH